MSRRSIRAYASATGERAAVCWSQDAARAAGHRELVAPPMYAAVYAGPAFRAVLERVECDLDRAVHGAQDLRWFALVHAGDEIETTARRARTWLEKAHRLHTIVTASRNRRGELVSLGTWTVIVRASGR